MHQRMGKINVATKTMQTWYFCEIALICVINNSFIACDSNYICALFFIILSTFFFGFFFHISFHIASAAMTF